MSIADRCGPSGTGPAEEPVGIRERGRLAAELERLVLGASRSRPGAPPPTPPLPQPDVAVSHAVAPALYEIAGALRDARRPVARRPLDDLVRFLSDGARSPLYRGDPTAARAAAGALRDVFRHDGHALPAGRPERTARPSGEGDRRSRRSWPAQARRGLRAAVEVPDGSRRRTAAILVVNLAVFFAIVALTLQTVQG